MKNRSSVLSFFKKFISEKNFFISDDSFVDEIFFVHFNQFVNIVEHVIEFRFFDLNAFVVVELFNVSIFDFFVSTITRSFFVIIFFAIYDDVYIIISTKNIISSFVFRFAIVIFFAMSNRSYVIVSKNMIVDNESSQFSINLQSFTAHFFSKSSFTNRQRVQKVVFVVTNSEMRFDIEFSEFAMFDDIATNIFMFEKDFFVFDDIGIFFSNSHSEFRSFKTSQSDARERDSKKNFISIDHIDCRLFDSAFEFDKFVMSNFTTDEIIAISRINYDFVNIDDSLFFFRFANRDSISSNFTSNILIDHENKFTFTIQFDHHLFDSFFAIFTFVTLNCSADESTDDDHDNRNFIIFANDFHVFFNSIKFVFDRRSSVKSIIFKRCRLKSKKILLRIWKRLKRSITNSSTVYVSQNCREYINRRIFKETSIETVIANEFFDTRRTICKHENIDYTFSFIDMFKEEIDTKIRHQLLKSFDWSMMKRDINCRSVLHDWQQKIIQQWKIRQRSNEWIKVESISFGNFRCCRHVTYLTRIFNQLDCVIEFCNIVVFDRSILITFCSAFSRTREAWWLVRWCFDRKQTIFFIWI